MSAYIRRAVIVDGACALAASLLAFEVRFENSGRPCAYLLLSCGLPVLWCAAVAIAGGYGSRIVGLGSDKFRRVLNAAVSFPAVRAVFSYAAGLDIARGYVAITSRPRRFSTCPRDFSCASGEMNGILLRELAWQLEATVVKPGFTGLWQVSGRPDLTWTDAVRLDLRCVENWSLALDLQILWKTGSAVFHGHGAY